MSDRERKIIALEMIALVILTFVVAYSIGKHAADRWYAEHPTLTGIIPDGNPDIVTGTANQQPWIVTSGAAQQVVINAIRIICESRENGDGTVNCSEWGKLTQ